MPFDASIILGSKPIDTNQNALQQFLQLQQFKQQQQANALAQQAQQLQIQQTQQGIQADRDIKTQLTADPNSTPQQILARGGIRAVPVVDAMGKAALNKSTIEKNTADTKKADADRVKTLNETREKQVDQTGDIAYGLMKSLDWSGNNTAANDQSVATSLEHLKIIDPAGAQQAADAYSKGGLTALKPLLDGAIQGSKTARVGFQKDVEIAATAAHNKDEAGHWATQDQTAQGQLKVAQQSADQTGKYQQGELRNSGVLANVAVTKENREQQKQDIELGGMDETAKQISDLNAAPPSSRSPLYNATMIRVNKVRQAEGKAPYDATEWTQKQETAKDFASSGDSGKQATALNTLVRHSYDMKDAISKLDNKSFTPGNYLIQKISQLTGQPAATNFDQLKQYVVGETVKLIRGSGGSEADVKRAEDSLNRASSPQQLAGAMDINFEVAGGKMQAMNQVARRYLRKPDFNVLDPEAGKLLDQMGYDTETLKRKPKQPSTTISPKAQQLLDKYLNPAK